MAHIQVRDEAHWHELRAKHIGGSDIAGLFGLSSFTTRWQLWMEKSGRMSPEDISDNKSIQAGTFLESGIAAWAAHRWKMPVTKVSDYYTVDDCPGMGSTSSLTAVILSRSSGRPRLRMAGPMKAT